MHRFTYDKLADIAAGHGLLTMGGLHPDAAGAKGLSGGTLVLFGAGDRFWPEFKLAPESRDGRPDPVDRWSRRVIGGMADALGAEAHYPFGGPPHAPFLDWAVKSGRAFASPTGMLVHETVGLMISYRGALHFRENIALPVPPAISPCSCCIGQPCVTACPVGALGGSISYDVDACHAHLDHVNGAACLRAGCNVRRACPVSAGANRSPEQSAHHMKAFHPS